MARVLITGASGFVGASLARRVVLDGHVTTLIVRKPLSDAREPWRLRGIADDMCSIETDLRDREGVRRAVLDAKPDWVFHLAAFGAYPSQTDARRIFETNVLGSMNLIDACIESGAEALIQSGSSSEYGYKNHRAEETEVIQPNSVYAVAKAAATHYGQFQARKSNFNIITARLYSIYGPYEEPSRLMPTLLVHGFEKRLPPLVSPATARDFVYVDDAVEGMIRLAKAPSIARGSIFNLCSGIQSTLAAVVESARELLDISAAPQWATMPARSWDTDVWVGSPEALKTAIDWTPSIGLTEGMRRMIAWLRDNPEMLSFYRSAIQRQ